MSIYREEYSAYEDLAAMLDALLRHARDPQVLVLERLLDYRPGDARVNRVLELFGVRTGSDLYSRLELNALIPAWWNAEFPGFSLELALRNFCEFVVIDCSRNQKETGLRAFNKIKHGLLWVPNGQAYLASAPQGPAAIFDARPSDPGADGSPVALFSVPFTHQDAEERLRCIHFIQLDLRLLAALLVVRDYPATLSDRGVGSGAELFRRRELADVLDFVARITVRDSGSTATE